MKPIAIIEAERPGLDSVIIWDDGERLVAFAYENGRVKSTRPINVETTFENAIAEVRSSFKITEGQFTRLHNFTEQPARTERIVNMPTRWT